MRQGVLDLAFGLMMLIVGSLLFYESFDAGSSRLLAGHQFPPMFYPRILLAIWMLLSLTLIGRGALLLKVDIKADRINLVRVGICMVLCGIYVAWLVPAVGFLIASIPFAFVLTIFLGARHKFWVPAISIGFPVIAWYVFQSILRIPLPRSPWFLNF
ncbi:MAG: tripartite tricarboxylate transporter TctB family protein [Aquisalimonadaceae bacterium]